MLPSDIPVLRAALFGILAIVAAIIAIGIWLKGDSE